MNKEEFNKLAKKHLFALESYKVDKNGNTKLEVFGVDKLYEAINFTGSSLQLKKKETPTFAEWLITYRFNLIKRLYELKGEMLNTGEMFKYWERNIY